MTQLNAWTVVLQWDCGRITVNTTVAPDAAAAAALSAVGSLRSENAPTGMLVSSIVTPIDIEWLRWALRSIDDGAPLRGSVVSLVQSDIRPNGAA